MKRKRIMIAAPKSGSGKTTITCGILQMLKNMGENVVSFKCGPDYIDPMFHKMVLHIPSRNLDTFFTGESITKTLFMNHCSENDFAVMEGVMGLYDGLGGVREEGSSYHLAKVTKTPIILVVDAKGMGRSVIAMIAGFLSYDTAHLIKGVFLNRTSRVVFEILKPLIENELQIPVVGYFPDEKSFQLKSRYLGLVMPDELDNIKGQIEKLAFELQKTVSLDTIIQIASEAEELDVTKEIISNKNRGTVGDECPVIAVAKDEAFCFYYEDNLALLEEYGAKISYFSPLHDEHLPEVYHGILIGGGYPELYAEALSRNFTLLSELKGAFENQVPMVAECGGFMYLHDWIRDQNGMEWPMAGIIAGGCHNKEKLVRFGYIEVEEIKSNYLCYGETIRGHEFHYYDSEDNGSDCTATKPVTKRGYPCIHSKDDYWFGFPHLYYPSNPIFAKNFVAKALNYRNRK